ncbi:MAG: hypothetical protein BMS9Abin07_0790 [Acidimicrobiia bacterium]|nr:MAG: hypothetical protein BMS9Abin07_0790 [Acidimicrobiia bacterium]
MADHPNAELYRKGLERFTDGDVDAMAEMLADDVVWWQIGMAEPMRGKAAVIEQMAVFEAVEFDLDIHDVVANDEHTVALVSVTVRAGDQEFSYRTAEIVHFSGGKVTERWAFSDDTEAIAGFFAQFAGD